jgi:hypothetical protein
VLANWRPAVVPLLLALTACASPATSPSPGVESPKTTQPSVAPTPCGTFASVTAANILFASDLTDRCPGALEGHDDQERTASTGPRGYRVTVKGGPDLDAGSGPDARQFSSPPSSDVRVEVDAEKIGGPDHNFFGIECRVTVQRNQLVGAYGLVVGSDGGYAIEKHGPGAARTTLTTGQAPDAIRAGANHVRADCVGTTLTLAVNGRQLAAVQDSEFNGNLAGVYVRSLDRAGAEIVFTNLVIAKP